MQLSANYKTTSLTNYSSSTYKHAEKIKDGFTPNKLFLYHDLIYSVFFLWCKLKLFPFMCTYTLKQKLSINHEAVNLNSQENKQWFHYLPCFYFNKFKIRIYTQTHIAYLYTGTIILIFSIKLIHCTINPLKFIWDDFD